MLSRAAKIVCFLVALWSAPFTVHAQIVPLDGATDPSYLAVLTNPRSGGCGGGGFGFGDYLICRNGVPLNYYAPATQVNGLQSQVSILQGQVGALGGLQGQFTGLQGQVNGLQGQVTGLQGQFATLQGQVASLDSRFSSFAAQVSSALDRSNQLIAVAAAMKDAIPNPGDRFAVRLNAAAFNGQSAGAIGLSYNVTERARVSVNYGQARSEAIVSGGLNMSFR